MATKIYESRYLNTIDGDEIYITPLKIKYLRQFMDIFENIKLAESDDEGLSAMVECVIVSMKQYRPEIKTAQDVEDNFDLPTIYQILDVSAGISISKKESDKKSVEKTNGDESSWDNLDLAKLESEAFLLGIWKDYEDLESHMSMPELVAILEAKRESEYQEKKFLAAIQGVDLDKNSGRDEEDPWEAMKARVFSGGKSSNPNDITSLQGINAQKAGFGIGMGLGYEDLTKK
jgi:hypothetical protein